MKKRNFEKVLECARKCTPIENWEHVLAELVFWANDSGAWAEKIDTANEAFSLFAAYNFGVKDSEVSANNTLRFVHEVFMDELLISRSLEEVVLQDFCFWDEVRWYSPALAGEPRVRTWYDQFEDEDYYEEDWVRTDFKREILSNPDHPYYGYSWAFRDWNPEF